MFFFFSSLLSDKQNFQSSVQMFETSLSIRSIQLLVKNDMLLTNICLRYMDKKAYPWSNEWTETLIELSL